MQPAVANTAAFAQRFAQVIDGLCEMAESYYRLGRVDDALKLLQAGMQLLEARDLRQEDGLKLLLQAAKILVGAYHLTNQDADWMFSTTLRAKQLAEAAQDQGRLAEALSLLGQAHYVATLNRSTTLSSSPDSYQEALSFQQQALEVREALQDTRGICQSLFFIGVVYERWQQHDRAQDYYLKAIQLAEHAGHQEEKAEPARHLAGIAWIIKGELDQALVYARESLAIWEAHGFQLFFPLAHLLVGDILQAQGDSVQALLQCQQAASLAEALRQNQALAFSLLSLGDIHLAQQQAAQAQAHFAHAYALAQQLQLPRLIARASERLERLAKQ
jgi:tetratricopeptide (TPR) repeat protein